jgi:Na+/proline symporter
MQAFTPASFIKVRYGNGAAICVVAWMCLVMVMYTLGQMIGLGQAFEMLFDMKYDFRWYFAPIPAFTPGPVFLPHLAMRVFTSSSVKSARWAVVWFAIFLGLLFSGTYVAGFAGNYFRATTGNVIEKADQTILVLNVFYNPTILAAFVMGGALAAGLSTIGGNLMAISGLVGNDLPGIVAPDMDRKGKMRWGYIALMRRFGPASARAAGPFTTPWPTC